MSSGSFHITHPLREMKFSGKSHANFTRYHLLAAETSAFCSVEIENKYKDDPAPPQDKLDLYLSQVSTAIICSVAALESNINEYIIDNQKALENPSFVPPPKLLKKYKKLKKDNTLKEIFDSPSVRLKYDIVSLLLKNCMFTTNNHKDIQRASCFIEIRNKLVHFTPKWDTDPQDHAPLENNYKKYCPSSPFYREEIEFPHFLSSKCATHCYEASINFIELFKLHIS